MVRKTFKWGFLILGMLLLVWVVYDRWPREKLITYFLTCHCPSCERVSKFLDRLVANEIRKRLEIHVVDVTSPQGQAEQARLFASAQKDFATFGVCPAIFRYRGDTKAKPLILLGEKEIRRFMMAN